MKYCRLALIPLVVATAVSLLVAGGFDAGRIDDFESGTVEGWIEAGGGGIGSSPNPPVNVSSGGPGGGSDNYLSNTSSGLAGAGGRMVMRNLEWSGDWIAAQADMVSMDLRNLGANALTIRIAIASSSGNWYASNDSHPLSPGGAWLTGRLFDLDDMAPVGTPSETLQQVLADVAEVRILSSAAGGSRNGDLVAGVLGMNDFQVVEVPVEVQSFSID